MAISTRLGRCYRCSCRCSAHRVREQGAQGRQRGQGRNRLRRRARGAAYDGVEHPDRDLLQARVGRIHETAARRCARRSLDHLVKANRAPSPGMPSVDNRDLVASCRTMGLVVRSCTMAGDPTPALTGRRRTRPTSIGCRNPWQPKPGRAPLIAAQAAVQTNRATSVLGGTSSGHCASAITHALEAGRFC
jgi:hypothetical protein